MIENVAAAAFFAGDAPSIPDAKEQARTHLAFVGLGDFAELPASALALPNRKRLELAKSIAKTKAILNEGVRAKTVGLEDIQRYPNDFDGAIRALPGVSTPGLLCKLSGRP